MQDYSTTVNAIAIMQANHTLLVWALFLAAWFMTCSCTPLPVLPAMSLADSDKTNAVCHPNLNLTLSAPTPASAPNASQPHTNVPTLRHAPSINITAPTHTPRESLLSVLFRSFIPQFRRNVMVNGATVPRKRAVRRRYRAHP